MFFRRAPIKQTTFEERLESLRSSGFAVAALEGGAVEVRRADCAAVVGRSPDGAPQVAHLGILLGGEIAALIDGGFQKFLESPSGTRRPALASHLRALHDFQEDLHQALGIESLYNESLGTVCDHHAYDRLTGRA